MTPHQIFAYVQMCNGAGFECRVLDSICSLMVIGTAGSSLFCGTDPVIATVIMQGMAITRLLRLYAVIDIPGAFCSSSVKPAQAVDGSALDSSCTFEIPVFTGVRHDQRCGSPIATIPATYQREPLLLTCGLKPQRHVFSRTPAHGIRNGIGQPHTESPHLGRNSSALTTPLTEVQKLAIARASKIRRNAAYGSETLPSATRSGTAPVPPAQ